VIENTYGMRKRLEFIASIVSDFRPKQVLDVGCGTGANLTGPLALQFPQTSFVGIDSDAASIAFATRENRNPNARYLVEPDFADSGAFDLVIASEVIEHVEDPEAFLNFLRSLLAPGGRLVLTLPNGFGPFELVSFVEAIMHLTGIYRVLWTLKHMLRSKVASPIVSDTLAVSPHINFFSYRQIRSVISAGGFQVLAYRPRTFLCGFGFDQLMQAERIVDWNADIADCLPPQMASAWMFLLTPVSSTTGTVFTRTAFARFRRRINEKRWNLR
jgi:SAM-dependent methyltransferase